MDSAFGLSAQKSRVVAPVNFVTAVKASKAGNTTFQEYLKAAENVYRKKRAAKVVTPVPGHGLPATAVKRITRDLSGPNSVSREIQIVWAPLDNERTVFDIDRENDQIVLNAHYRSVILQGARGSATDAPIVKTLLLFLLVRDEFNRQRESAAQRQWLQDCNSALYYVLRATK